ncbi:MAG: DUF1326 domain-containing protein [Candidatus Dormibacteraeota bacterium]|nr:DUF1326 domain-containing protein [Candidatus Dormibacteraeota bacterium]
MSTSWRIAGPYFESCNCEAICPCRMVDGKPGSRATYRYCQFAIGWTVADGHYGDLELGDRTVVMVGYWDEDERGAPWRVGVYVDDGATGAQRDLLAGMVTGRQGGTPAGSYAAAISEVLFVEPAAVEIDHKAGKQWIKVSGHVKAQAAGRFETDSTVTCGVPGHDRKGYEVIMDLLQVNGGGLDFSFKRRCGFAASFDYRSD